jgi:hypothetical protein
MNCSETHKSQQSFGVKYNRQHHAHTVHMFYVNKQAKLYTCTGGKLYFPI